MNHNLPRPGDELIVDLPFERVMGRVDRLIDKKTLVATLIRWPCLRSHRYGMGDVVGCRLKDDPHRGHTWEVDPAVELTRAPPVKAVNGRGTRSKIAER